MKRLFRSIIDIKKNGKPTIEMQDLQKNYEEFTACKVENQNTHYSLLYSWIEAHRREYDEIPSYETLESRARAVADEEILAFLLDVKTEVPHIGSNYKSLLVEIHAEQMLSEFSAILSKTFLIASEGVKLNPKSTVVTQGIPDALAYLNGETSQVLKKMDREEIFFDVAQDDLDEIFSIDEGQTLLFPFTCMAGHLIRATDLVFVAAYAGTGKTTYLNHHAATLMMQGKNGLYFALEAPPADVYQGIYLGMYNNYLFPKNPIPESRLTVLHDKSAAETLKTGIRSELSTPGIGSIEVKMLPGLTPDLLYQESCRHRNRLAKRGRRLDYIALDYAGLMTPSSRIIRNMDHTSFTNTLIRELKISALKLRVPIISAYQINREGKKRQDKSESQAAKRPKLYDLANGSEAEKSCDKVLFLYPIYDDATTNITNFELIMAKARKEKSGEKVVYNANLHRDTKIWTEVGPEEFQLASDVGNFLDIFDGGI